MGPIRVAIIDDNDVNRILLRSFVELHDGLAVVGEAADAVSGAEMIREVKPDAVFLDIQMPSQSGLDMLRRLESPPRIVFVTCLPQHALEAIELEAVDYLIKPVTPERFAVSVQRLKRLFHSGSGGPEEEPVALRDGSTTQLVLPSDLIILHAEAYLTRLVGVRGLSLLIGKSLGDFERQLPPEVFVRVDRSTMVNAKRLVRLDHAKRLLWLQGLDQPVEVGRAACERLRDLMRRDETPVS